MSIAIRFELHDAARNGIEGGEFRKQIADTESSDKLPRQSSRRPRHGGCGDEGEALNHEAEERRDCTDASVVRLWGAEVAEAGNANYVVGEIGDLLGGLRGVLQLQHHGRYRRISVLGVGSRPEHCICRYFPAAAIPVRRALESQGLVRESGGAGEKAL